MAGRMTDAYYSPRDLASLVAEIADLPAHDMHIAEPSYGDGALVHAVAARRLKAYDHWTLCDTNESEPPTTPGCTRYLYWADWIGVARDHELWPTPRPLCRAAIMNPPYSGAKAGLEHVEAALQWAEGGSDGWHSVTSVLPVRAMHTPDRARWWVAHPPQSITYIAERPRWFGPAADDGGTSARHDIMICRWTPDRTRTEVDWRSLRGPLAST